MSFWVLPAAMGLMAILLSFALMTVDNAVDFDTSADRAWIFTSSGDGARSVLSTIAGSMITVAGVVLSSMVVVLTLASQQFGPRLVRNFIKDYPSQFVIGAFTGCFLYNILVLRTIGASEDSFVPHISVLVGLFLAVLCIGGLIFFVHHVSVTIQVQSIMRRVKADLDEAIEEMFPNTIAADPDEAASAIIDGSKRFERDGGPLKASRSGYLQAIREDRLLELCQKHDCLLRIHARPGDFVVRDEIIGELNCNNAKGDDSYKAIRKTFVIGKFPTCEQDVLFPINQLEEMAIRALSPGINDPHTAMECVDYLTASLCTLITRPWPNPNRYDADARLRVIAEPYGFDRILREAFQQLHYYGRNDIAVVCRIVRALTKLATLNPTDADRRMAIESFLNEIVEKSQKQLPHKTEINQLNQVYATCSKTIDTASDQ